MSQLGETLLNCGTVLLSFIIAIEDVFWHYVEIFVRSYLPTVLMFIFLLVTTVDVILRRRITSPDPISRFLNSGWSRIGRLTAIRRRIHTIACCSRLRVTVTVFPLLAFSGACRGTMPIRIRLFKKTSAR